MADTPTPDLSPDALEALDRVLTDIEQDAPSADARVCVNLETDDEHWLSLDAEFTVGELRALAPLARIGLAVVEAKPETVERVARVINATKFEPLSKAARAVLAALAKEGRDE